jgi:hypothetical protein
MPHRARFAIDPDQCDAASISILLRLSTNAGAAFTGGGRVAAASKPACRSTASCEADYHRVAAQTVIGPTCPACTATRPAPPATAVADYNVLSVGRGFGDQCNVAPTSASQRSVAAHRADPFAARARLVETAAGKISQLSQVPGGAICSGPPKKAGVNVDKLLDLLVRNASAELTTSILRANLVGQKGKGLKEITEDDAHRRLSRSRVASLRPEGNCRRITDCPRSRAYW